MRKVFFIFALLLSATSARATVWQSPSCSQTDVQNTISAGTTVTGDTVQVLGPCTLQFSSFVTIPSSKGITVQGVSNPTISSTSEGFLVTQGAATTRITGFTCNRAGNTPTDFNGHCFQVVSPVGTATWRLDHNTFCAGGGSCTTPNTIFMSITGNGPGLIDHNSMQGNGSAWIQAFGDGGDGSGWRDNIVPGGSQMLFIEDNNIKNPVCNAASQGCQATNSGGWIQAYNGARIVSRHNIFTMVTLDHHGSANGGAECGGGTSNCPGAEGVRWYEHYNNDYEGVQGSNPANQNQWFSYMDVRAGAGVIFNNTFNPNGVLAASNQLGVRLREENTCPWPQSYQIGTGINGFTANCASEPPSCPGNLNTAPTHLWGNTGTFNFFNSPVTGNVQQNRDYFLDSSQPASIHWEEASGDTCSTTYVYTPYTYPHPLVSGTTSPSLVISPNPVNFGNQRINVASSSIVTTVTNSGSANEVLSTPYQTITGTNAGDFSISGATCTNGGTITSSGGSCTVSPIFTPTAIAGTQETAMLNIFGTVNSSVVLSGTSVDVTLSFAPNPFSPPVFQNVITGTTSQTGTLTISNVGGFAETISSITLGGGNAADFTLTGGTCGGSLAPGASCTKTLTFTPSTTSAETTTLTITGTATSGNTVTINGNGIPVPVQPAPSTNAIILSVGASPGVIDLVIGNCPKTCKIHLVCSNCAPIYTGTVQ